MRRKSYFITIFLLMLLVSSALSSRRYEELYGKTKTKPERPSNTRIHVQNLEKQDEHSSLPIQHPPVPTEVFEEVVEHPVTLSNDGFNLQKNTTKIFIGFLVGLSTYLVWMAVRRFRQNKEVVIQLEPLLDPEIAIREIVEEMIEKSVEKKEPKRNDGNDIEDSSEDPDSLGIENKEYPTDLITSSSSRGRGIVVQTRRGNRNSKRLSKTLSTSEIELRRMIKGDMDIRSRELQRKEEKDAKEERRQHLQSMWKLTLMILQLTFAAWAIVLYWNVETFLSNALSYREAQHFVQGGKGLISVLNSLGFGDLVATIYQYTSIILVAGGMVGTILILFIATKVPGSLLIFGVFLLRSYLRSIVRLVLSDVIILALSVLPFTIWVVFFYSPRAKKFDPFAYEFVLWGFSCLAAMAAGYHAANTDFSANPNAEYETFVDPFLSYYWPR